MPLPHSISRPYKPDSTTHIAIACKIGRRPTGSRAPLHCIRVDCISAARAGAIFSACATAGQLPSLPTPPINVSWCTDCTPLRNWGNGRGKSTQAQRQASIYIPPYMLHFEVKGKSWDGELDPRSFTICRPQWRRHQASKTRSIFTQIDDTKPPQQSSSVALCRNASAIPLSSKGPPGGLNDQCPCCWLVGWAARKHQRLKHAAHAAAHYHCRQSVVLLVVSLFLLGCGVPCSVGSTVDIRRQNEENNDLSKHSTANKGGKSGWTISRCPCDVPHSVSSGNGPETSRSQMQHLTTRVLVISDT